VRKHAAFFRARLARFGWSEQVNRVYFYSVLREVQQAAGIHEEFPSWLE
jgi:hypothetical protein